MQLSKLANVYQIETIADITLQIDYGRKSITIENKLYDLIAKKVKCKNEITY